MKIVLVFVCVITVTVNVCAQQYQGPHHIPVITKNGVPLDTPEVQAAKERHLAAVAAAARRNGVEDNRIYETSGVEYQRDRLGIPQDTPEVQAAKARHFASLNAANQGRVGFAEEFGPNGIFGFASEIGFDGRVPQRYVGPLHIPVLTRDGVPLDTPEVQAARAKHLNALAAAAYENQIRGGNDWYGNRAGWLQYGFQNVPEIASNGIPLDTPEVREAKQRHFEALRNAGAQRNYQVFTEYQ